MKPKPTIIDVAKKARVSIATVSRVLNGVHVREQSRVRVEKAVQGLGYRHNKIAQGLVTGRSGVIGVIIPGIMGHLYGQMSRGIEEILTSQGLHMVIVTNTRNADEERENLRLLLERRVDAVIVMGSYLHDEDLHALHLHVPIVFIQREVSSPKSCYSLITIDNRSGVEAALNYLIKAGHRHIAHVSGLRWDGLERQQLFQEFMKRAKLPSDYIFKGNFVEERAFELASDILKTPKLTAVFCSNDRTALGLYRALHGKGVRVPEDMSIIGFDDEPWTGYIEPPLTTLRQPGQEVGRLAAQQIVAELNGKQKNYQRVPVTFIERASVYKIKAVK
ncbi:MAG: LacI family DNA-binding transcriptional regulator [Trueperaceae bacterium]